MLSQDRIRKMSFKSFRFLEYYCFDSWRTRVHDINISRESGQAPDKKRTFNLYFFNMRVHLYDQHSTFLTPYYTYLWFVRLDESESNFVLLLLVRFAPRAHFIMKSFSTTFEKKKIIYQSTLKNKRCMFGGSRHIRIP